MSAEIKALKMFLTISITDMGKMEGYPHSSTIQLSISVDYSYVSCSLCWLTCWCH